MCGVSGRGKFATFILRYRLYSPTAALTFLLAPQMTDSIREHKISCVISPDEVQKLHVSLRFPGPWEMLCATIGKVIGTPSYVSLCVHFHRGGRWTSDTGGLRSPRIITAASTCKESIHVHLKGDNEEESHGLDVLYSLLFRRWLSTR